MNLEARLPSPSRRLRSCSLVRSLARWHARPLACLHALPLRRSLAVALTAAAIALTFAIASPPAFAQQGVSKTEIVVGTIVDLSGPLAGYGKDQKNGMLMRVAEANDQGGVHGRKLKLVLEDNGYDPKRAVLAAQKLVNQDRIFVMAGLLGTAGNNAAFPVLRGKGVMNFLPVSLSRDMYEPVDKLKFAFLASSAEQLGIAAPRLFREKSATRACTLYQDDDFGHEVLRGAESGLRTIGVELGERTTYKRGATDFSSQVARLKEAGCDFVVLGTIVRETVGVLAEARKLGYAPTLLATSAAYSELIPKLGGPATDGLYATMQGQIPYEDDASGPLRSWAGRYRAAFGEAPTVFSTYGYLIIDRLVTALARTGAELTTEALAQAIEAMSEPADLFGFPPMRWSAANHLATKEHRLSQLQEGRWKVVLDYDRMKPTH